MCEMCTQHGEGKKWYLQAKAYEREIEAGEKRVRDTGSIEKYEETAVTVRIARDKMIAADDNSARKLIVSKFEESRKRSWIQVVPLEDAEQILDNSSSIVRMSCNCRTMRGVHNARYCIGINTGSRYLDLIHEYPDYSQDYEQLTKEEAKQLFREFDLQGQVHLVFARTPFIEAICNCDSVYCQALKARQRFDYPFFIKSEYVSAIDWDKCNGCRECMKMCNFGAISYSSAVEKCYIDQFKCCGSGLCRSVCPANAITMHDRNAIPALAKEW
jgi:ferredoxin